MNNWKERVAFLEVGKQAHNRCGGMIMSLVSPPDVRMLGR